MVMVKLRGKSQSLGGMKRERGGKERRGCGGQIVISVCQSVFRMFSTAGGRQALAGDISLSALSLSLLSPLLPIS
ncbi:hypothetical protein VNO80_14280 [Phaseolus coccineus]|uniref:Uncharacterized protein n=1 Tax=Phaseolus coccineus TaxID=3886 RepID=A0AAN9MHM2_PHACN